MGACIYQLHLTAARKENVKPLPQLHRAHKSTVLELYELGKVSVCQAVNAGAKLSNHRVAYQLARKQRRALPFRRELKDIIGRRV